jgi:class 3 adenylate cyclase
VVDAVRCADEIQRSVAEQNTDVPQDKRIEFRIGVHVGDIIIDENDIYGEGVNIIPENGLCNAAWPIKACCSCEVRKRDRYQCRGLGFIEPSADGLP